MLTIDVQAVPVQAVVAQFGDIVGHGAQLLVKLFSVKPGQAGIVLVAAHSVHLCVIPVPSRPREKCQTHSLRHCSAGGTPCGVFRTDTKPSVPMGSCILHQALQNWGDDI